MPRTRLSSTTSPWQLKIYIIRHSPAGVHCSAAYIRDATLIFFFLVTSLCGARILHPSCLRRQHRHHLRLHSHTPQLHRRHSAGFAGGTLGPYNIIHALARRYYNLYIIYNIKQVGHGDGVFEFRTAADQPWNMWPNPAGPRCGPRV